MPYTGKEDPTKDKHLMCRHCKEPFTWNEEGKFWHCVQCDALGFTGVTKRQGVVVYRSV